MAAAKVQPTVSATRYPRLRSIPQLYWVRARGGFARLPKRREYGLRRQSLLEGDDTSLDGLGERLGGRAEPLRDGYQHAVAPLAGFPQQRGPLHEVTLGPEAEHLEVDPLPGPGVPQGEVRHERGLSLREGEDAGRWFQLPGAGVLRALPGADEGFAHGVRLVLAAGSEVVALEAGQEPGQSEPVLAGGAEDGERAIEAEPVAAGDRFERVDQTLQLDVVEDEPGVGFLPEVHDEVSGGVEYALHLGHVVAGDEIFGERLLECLQDLSPLPVGVHERGRVLYPGLRGDLG